ncbi:hypothetical protein [Citrobacter koseri]|uniref:hypothetical protein n=1 Tax=Citrobacter koseri TaxID=545 RepID=UPI000E02E9BE|nr:hypothetical protein [Citrobacter koseri]STB73309.1 Uncharacterised protein [Citrobacter koseri]STT23488.1 Uncharacterised protein [Citrobacter koseri]
MKQQVKMVSALTVLIAGLMGAAGVAQAASSAAGLKLTAVVTKTTCDVTVNGSGGVQQVSFGSFTPDEIAAYTTASPLKGAPVTLSFGNCTGASVAGGGEVNLIASGVPAAGSSNTAYGDSATDRQIGYNLALAWTNGGDSDVTAESGTLTPGNQFVTIYKAVDETDVGDVVLPDVTVTPQLFNWNAVNIPAQVLDSTVNLSIAYN